MTSTSSWTGLIFDPLDTLFFRDGRPFDAANRVQSGLPTPQTLAGAVRTNLLARTGFLFSKLHSSPHTSLEQRLLDAGADAGIVHGSFRGPFLAMVNRDNQVEPLLPLPNVLAKAKVGANAKWSRSAPSVLNSVPGWNDADGLSPLQKLTKADPKAERGLLPLSELSQFLNGLDPDPNAMLSERNLFATEHRVGIAIDHHTLTCSEGQIYAIGLLALRNVSERSRKNGNESRVCLYAEFQLGDRSNLDLKQLLHDTPLLFGGEGRAVHVTIAKAPAVWPASNPAAARSMWYLAQPTFLPMSPSTGRPLPRLSGLTGAASSAGVAISGWDGVRHGPRPTRFAVPAGAVYFVDGPGDETAFLDNQLPDSVNLRREGWGFALQGVWKEE